MKEIFNRNKYHKMETLDGLRAISILLVITFHAYFFSQYSFNSTSEFINFSQGIPFYFSWIKRGDLGVDIFFVLSAFLIGSHLFKERLKNGHIILSRFYTKRLLRIYPVYVFALCLIIIGDGWDPHVFLNIFALNNIFELKKIVIPWSWSLTVEIQFYLLCPFIVLWITSGRKLTLLTTVLVVVSIVWTAVFYLSNQALQQGTVIDIINLNDQETILYYMQFLYVVPPVRVAAFAFGLAAAWLWIFKQEAIRHYFAHNPFRRRLLISTSLAGMLIIASIDMYQPMASMSFIEKEIYKLNMIAGRPLFTLFVTTLLLISLLPQDKKSMTHKILSSPMLYPIARVSYSMYLFHPVFLFASFYLLFGESKLTTLSAFDFISLAGLGILFSFCFGVITYYAIERWFIEGRFERWLPAKKTG